MTQTITRLFILLLTLTLTHRALAETPVNTGSLNIIQAFEESYENAPAITLRFNEALDDEGRFSEHIEVNQNNTLVEANWVLGKDAKTITMIFIEPNIEYDITVNPGIKTASGSKLEKTYRKKIQTRELLPAISFASKGNLLAPNKRLALPLTTVNVSEIDIDFYRVKPEQLGQFFNINWNGKTDVYSLRESHQWMDLVHTGRYKLTIKKNQRQDINLDVGGINTLKEPGLYVAIMRKAGSFDYQYSTTYFSVSDIALHARQYSDHWSVFTHSIDSSKTLEQQKIHLLDNQGAVLSTIETDANGYGKIAKHKKGRYLQATNGRQLTLLRLNTHALDLSAFNNATLRHQDIQAFVYGPRDLYMPGESVDINLLLRDYDGKNLKTEFPLNARLQSADGSIAKEFVWQPSTKGFYQWQYNLPDKAATGGWTLTVSAGNFNHSYRFNVEDFLPERMALQIFDGKPEKKSLPLTNKISIPVEGSYLYGAPASGNKVNGFISAKADGYIFEQHKTWYMGNSSLNLGQTRINIPDTLLNAKGIGDISLDNPWKNIKSPIVLNASLSLHETGGRPVTRTVSIGLLPNTEKLLALEPQFSENPDSDSLVEFKLGAFDTQGNFVDVKDLTVTLIRDYRSYFWRYSDSRGWYWDFESNPYKVMEKTLDIDKKTGKIQLPVEWGEYRVELTRKGSPKTVFKFSTDYSSWWSNSDNNQNRKPDTVQLAIAQTEVVPGTAAKVTLIPPHAGNAVVTIENSDGIIWQDYFAVEEAGTTIDIPTQKDWDRHDLYVTAMVIQDSVARGLSPKRAFAFTHLPLARADRQLKMALTAPTKVEPGDTAKASVSLVDAPKDTRVTIALVDVGVLNITRFERPKPEEKLFSPRRFEANLFDVYGNIIEYADNPFARQRFGGDLAKLKDMSAANLSRGGKKAKSEVQIVSFMSEPVAINDQGIAEFSFTMPQFNGSLRWMAVAFSDQAYASNETDMKVVDRVVTQISMPRFLATGDKSRIALDVHNVSGATQTLDINMSFSDAIAQPPFTKKMTLKDKQKHTFTVDLKAPVAIGQGAITLTVDNKNNAETNNKGKPITIKRSWTLGVRPAYPAQTFNTRVKIEANGEWKNSLDISHLIESSIEGQLTVSDKPPIAFASHFNYMLNYPYGCLEQTTSSGMPWLLLTPRIATHYLKQPFDAEKRSNSIEAAIDRLAGKQKANGSFGFWDASSQESYWASVYAAEFLSQAQLEGIEVPSNMLSKLTSRLTAYVRKPSTIRPQYSSIEYRYITQAYAGYVLSQLNKASISDLRRLYGQIKNKKLPALSWVHLGLAFDKLGDKKTAKDIIAKSRLGLRPQQYYGDYGSDVRDLALSYSLLNDRGFQADQHLFALSKALKTRRWLSTQERVALMRVAKSSDSETAEPWQATVILNEKPQVLKESSNFNTILNAEQSRALDTIKAADKDLYVNFTVVGHPAKKPKSVSNGIDISKRYFDLDGRKKDIARLNSGELILVEIVAKVADSKQRIPDALIVDLLPAGLELENQNLGNASVGLDKIMIAADGADGADSSSGNNNSVNNNGTKKVSAMSLHKKNNLLHEEYRSDRYVAAFDMKAYKTYRLFYLARAVTPGTFVVPPSYIEDMYRPSIHGISETIPAITVNP